VLFKNYADKENPDTIGAQNFGQLCADANIPMDGALPLLLFWQLGAQELGIISKEEWTKTMDELKRVVHLLLVRACAQCMLRISSLSTLRIFLSDMDDLLLTNSPPRTVKKDGQPYDRAQYFAYANDRKGSFTKFYTACFLLVKTGYAMFIPYCSLDSSST
jgi:DCN1-like protein 4/5